VTQYFKSEARSVRFRSCASRNSLKDLRIPPTLIPAIKDELHAQFPHYWIFISTVNKHGVTCDSLGEHYNFIALTALDSYHLPSPTSETLHPGRQQQRGKDLHPVVSGRALALSNRTKSGGKFVIINLYQFTAANPAEQKEVLGYYHGVGIKAPKRQNYSNR